MGYDPNFIEGFAVPLPKPSQRVLAASFRSEFIHHTRHSLLFNRERGFAFVTAHNIDGTTLPGAQYTNRDFEFDPEIDEELQVGNKQGYADRPDHYQRGHLTRRASMSWGQSADEIEAARRSELESDYYSNIAPQERRMHVAWGRVEDWMLDLTESGSTARRACVFQGPVFTEEDPEVTITDGFDAVQIPAGYWKIMAIRRDGALRAAGFLIWQRDYATPEPLSFAPVLEQVRLTTIEVLTGLAFPDLRNADAMIFAIERERLAELQTVSRSAPTDALGRIRDTAMVTIPNWTKSLFRTAPTRKPNIVSGPQDIII